MQIHIINKKRNKITMENILEETKFIMNKYGIKANKSLGQNFLINEEVINAIVECSNICNEDLVIEIGPGLGTLTKRLLEKAGKVVCIELDKKMLKILNDRFQLYNNFELINDDILKVDLKDLILQTKKNNNLKNAKVVANLPYYITTPIIMKLLEEMLDLHSITVMIQKEVADRLTETPGGKNTGAITYTIDYYSIPQKILEVPNSSFIPAPEVTSEVIKLNVKKDNFIKVKDKNVMFRIIKCAFMQRRKTLLNALTNAHVFINKEEGSQILNELNLNLNIRPEKLTLENYRDITDKVLEKTQKIF
jgi:16S rRNA (adenine1518-N6/adenine1519-N6)-dimethyltransferase